MAPPDQQTMWFYKSLQQQFHNMLCTWQKPLFGSIQKAGTTNTLSQLLNDQKTLMLVSDASIQKNGHSGFA